MTRQILKGEAKMEKERQKHVESDAKEGRKREREGPNREKKIFRRTIN